MIASNVGVLSLSSAKPARSQHHFYSPACRSQTRYAGVQQKRAGMTRRLHPHRQEIHISYFQTPISDARWIASVDNFEIPNNASMDRFGKSSGANSGAPYKNFSVCLIAGVCSPAAR